MIYSKSLQYFISIPACKLHTGAFLSFHLTQKMTKAHAIIRTTLTIGAETPLQRSLSQQVNLQSALASAFSASLHSFNTLSSASLHCSLGKQPFTYCFASMPETSKTYVPQLLMPAGQETSV